MAREGFEEVGFDEKSGLVLVKINPIYHRPAEVEALRGNPAKAERILGWRRHMDFRTLVKIMVETDDRRASIAKSHPERTTKRTTKPLATGLALWTHSRH
jgi:GDP-D-mannose dehydratase